MTDAILINPFSSENIAEAIRQAIEMPESERRQRMQKMQKVVQENNVYKWASDIVEVLSTIA